MPKFIKNKKIILITLIFFGLFILFIYSPRIIYENEVAPTSENIKTASAILEINGVSYENQITGPISVYDFMNKLRSDGKISFMEKNYTGMGKFIESINGISGNGKENWIYYVNGKKASIGVSNYKINNGDTVSWKYEKNY